MNEIDWIILVLLGLSTLLGALRGVVKESFAIVGWIAGAMLAVRYAGELADYIPLSSAGVIIRTIIAAILIVVVSVIAVGLVGSILRKLLEIAALSMEDRALGAVFGFVRGVVIVCVCVFVFGLSTQLTSSVLWRQSALIGPAESVIEWSLPYLPQWVQSMRQPSGTSA